MMMQTDLRYAAIVGLPHGALGVRCSESVISALDYLPAQPEVAPRWPLARETVAQLHAWLQEPAFRFELPLAPAGSRFQRRVWQEISAIACGETLTYGEVATAIRSGPRAVGNACGANPYPIVVPCHRVVGANQGIGGFARQRGGFLLDIKKWLLLHEHAGI